MYTDTRFGFSDERSMGSGYGTPHLFGSSRNIASCRIRRRRRFLSCFLIFLLPWTFLVSCVNYEQEDSDLHTTSGTARIIEVTLNSEFSTDLSMSSELRATAARSSNIDSSTLPSDIHSLNTQTSSVLIPHTLTSPHYSTVSASPSSDSRTTASASDKLTDADRIRKRPNELGELLIVLYHHIGGEDSLYYRSTASFKKDLKALYDKGYRSVSMEDFIRSSYDIPIGTTPVILTFDDGALSHFKAAVDAEGNPYPDPDCAVGILDAFSKEYPDFGRHAIFYINANAFHEPEYLAWKLKYLHENGYEIGNHTLTHSSLDIMDGVGIQKELGENVKLYQDIFPDIKMTSVAYPYGNRPKKELLPLVLEGKYNGSEYKHEIGLIASWCPTKPLYSKEMNPLEVYRVQGGVNAQQLDWWMDLLEREPWRRFISDGLPDRIFIPKSLESELSSDILHSGRIFVYEEAEESP